LFVPKLKLFVEGRKQTFSKLSILKPNDKVVWFHAASLGEFEQAIPLIELVKHSYSDYKIVVTFFSPSGYEIRKNYPLADVVCYLPFDSKRNIQNFLKLTHPSLAIIVKYEFWPNLLSGLKSEEIPTVLVSGIFRESQMFFKSYGGWMRKHLQAFRHFFVQDEVSENLLNKVGFSNTTVCGDTRLDRVVKIIEQDNSLDFISDFVNQSYTVVAGSTWLEDEELLIEYINNSTGQKFIIAPHNINEKEVLELQQKIRKSTVLFSKKEESDLKNSDVFILDTIGILTKVYSYADVAYVGGAFKTGLHNILEPASYGVPVVIGSEYSKFKEALDLVSLGGCVSVKDIVMLQKALDRMYRDTAYRKELGNINKKYVESHKGATQKIKNYIDTLL